MIGWCLEIPQSGLPPSRGMTVACCNVIPNEGEAEEGSLSVSAVPLLRDDILE
jgi:hypothetical protein